MDLPLQIRQNAVEYQDFLKDLSTWENSIKQKERVIKEQKEAVKANNIPSVRKVQAKQETIIKGERIKSSDYRAWDKLDVDKILDDMDDTPAEISPEPLLPTKNIAEEEKRKGNEQFKAGNYDKAIEYYTNSLEFEKNAIVYANRAISFLRLFKYDFCIGDCEKAISLDKRNIKAYYRRGLAYLSKMDISKALKDFESVLVYDPSNKAAKEEVEKIKLMQREKSRGKPLRRRLEIKEINVKRVGQVGSKAFKEVIVTGTEENIGDVIENKDFNQNEINNGIKDKETNTDTEINTSNGIDKDSLSAKDGNDFKENVKPLKNIPKAPSTNFEFERDWKTVCDNPELMFKYIQLIPTQSVQTVIKTSLNSHMLVAIIRALTFGKDGDFTLEFLTELSKVPRFSMNLSFLSKAEKLELGELFEFIPQLEPLKVVYKLNKK
jgi:tetratricopeptide (TPR) repeat protein